MSTPKKLLLLFAIIGTIDSAYLTVVHYTKLPLYCPQSTLVNCVRVTTSSLSAVGGIPIALAGLVWFVGLAVLVFLVPKMKVGRNIWIIFGIAGVGYSVIGQAILGTICEYCCLMDVLIILSIYLLVKNRDKF